MASYGDLIHASIMGSIESFKFRAITYIDSRTRITTTKIVRPRTIKVDQRSSAFVQSIRNRQSRFTERSSWTWIADVFFNGAASVEEFEQLVSRNPLRIPRDATDDRPQQVDIFLEELEEITHPPRQGGSTGTRARWRFVAELSPQ